jgi:lauroyl/myristoyl acyltransferase
MPRLPEQRRPRDGADREREGVISPVVSRLRTGSAGEGIWSKSLTRQEVERLRKIARWVPYPVGVRLIRWWTALSWVQRRSLARHATAFERLLESLAAAGVRRAPVHRALAINVGRDYRLAALARLSAPAFSRWVAVEGWEHVESALARGRGAILANQHTAVGQVLALVVRRRGLDLATVGDNSLKLALVSETESDARPRTRPPAGTDPQARFVHYLANARQVLIGGGLVQIPTDTYSGNGLVRLPLLGRGRGFWPGFAELADMTGAAVIPVFASVDGRERVVVRFHPPLAGAGPTAKRPERVEALMSSYRDWYERMWIESPEQFTFSHHERLLRIFARRAGKPQAGPTPGRDRGGADGDKTDT